MRMGGARDCPRVCARSPVWVSFAFLLQELLEGLSQATPTLDDHSMFSSSGSISPDLEDTVSHC